MENQLTLKQAIEIIGKGLADESLKLSQRDHAILTECWKLVYSFIDESEASKAEEKK